MASSSEVRQSVPGSASITDNIGSVLARLYIGVMYLVLLTPLFIIVGVSVTAGDYIAFPPEGYSLEHFFTLFSIPKWFNALQLSLTVAVGAAVLATSIGASLAFALNRYDITWGKAIWGLGVIPLLVPPVIVAVGMMSFFLLLDLWGTRLGIIIAHGIVFSPFSFVLISSGLDEIGDAVEEASRNLGASKTQTLRHVTFPLIASNIVVAALFAFILSLNEYLIALFVGGPGLDTIPVVIFASLRYNYSPIIAAVSVLYMAATMVGIFLINYRLDGQLW